MKLNEIRVARLFWCSYILTTIVYSYIAYQHYLEVGSTTLDMDMILYVFTIAGFISSALGTLIVRSNFLEKSKIKSIVSEFSNTKLVWGYANIPIFFFGFALIETVALFGLVGFLFTPNLTYIAFMFSIYLICWLLDSQENLDKRTVKRRYSGRRVIN